MNLSSISLADLKEIEALLKRKESLRAEIEDINKRLDNLDLRSGKSHKPVKGRVKGRRMNMQEAIIPVLKAAGTDGLHVKAIAERINAKEANVRAWFYSSAMKRFPIEKTDKPATYVWNENKEAVSEAPKETKRSGKNKK